MATVGKTLADQLVAGDGYYFDDPRVVQGLSSGASLQEVDAPTTFVDDFTGEVISVGVSAKDTIMPKAPMRKPKRLQLVRIEVRHKGHWRRI